MQKSFIYGRKIPSMHLHFEKNVNSKSDCSILCLSWMGKVPDDIPDDDGWKLNRTNYYQEGWLATGNVRGIVGVTFTTSNMKKKVDFPLRTNYNLRGHRSDVILVKWNEPYQKLASCDSSGIIFVWIKYEGRWSIELINDRNTPVTYFSWSHDGRMALICYQDGFVLVGSVAGQRYWSSMLNLESIITCGIWTPDDQQVYFGTTHGQVIVMDVHGAMVSQVQLSPSVGIMSMAWSCEKFKMEEDDDFEPVERMFILAVSFLNGYIYLLKSYDDLSPAQINTGLNGTVGFLMDWSNSTQLLAVAGASQNPMPQEDSSCTPIFSNHLRFYTGNGTLIYSSKIPNASTTVSALTWGHNDKRLFIATGSQIHIAWVSSHIASLQLLCRLEIQNKLSSEIFLDLLPLPSRIKTIIGNLFARTIPCCVPESKTLREYVSRPPVCSKRLHCTMIRHDDDLSISSGTCYTLYLEFLGGLVPLLKGKRTSKLRPEFVIFDPQVEDPSLFMEFFRSPKDLKRTHNTVKDQCQRADSSDSELGGRSYPSPRPSRSKKLNTNGKSQVNGENYSADTDSLDELSYLDTLPEHVKLVEVTSNIWGTKFKIHGLAKTVPANLGQVTYKTSLLHLQPRQMTLVITELSDDCSTEPDPTFNPNIFSEDEDDQAIENFLGTTQKIDPRQINDMSPAIAPMSPQHTRYTPRSKQPCVSNLRPGTGTSIGVCSLTHQESHDDDLLNGIEFRDMFTNQSSMRKNLESPSTNAILSCPNYAGLATQTSRVSSNSSSQSKYAVSPLCFEGSVPTLQSPKNAVAPSDIIFDRPPTRQTSLMSFASNTEYGKNLTHVKNVLLPEQPRTNNTHLHSLSLKFSELNERVDLNRQILYKTNEIDLWTKDDYKLAPSASNQTMNPAVKMKRSCSVGYLDYVNRTASEVASILMKETPNKRLVLVNKKLHKKKKLYQEDSRFSNLQKSGKSRSLDSCDIPATSVSKLRSASKDVDKHMNRLNRISENNVVGHKGSLCLKLQTHCDFNSKLHSPCPLNTHSVNTSSGPNHVRNNVIERIADTTSDSLSSESDFESKINLIRDASFSRLDNQHIVRKRSIFNSDKKSSTIFNNNHEQSKQVQSKQEDLIQKTDDLTPKEKSEATQVRPVDAKTFLSMHAQAITTLENIISRLKDLDERCVTLPATLQRQSHSLPASPTPNKKGARNQSASPIRQILKSPLLNRRQRKKPVEILGNKSQYSGAEIDTSVPQYQGLESFQKSQLRQKLLRSNIESKGSVCSADVSFSRRKFVMHNKAPLWNENSQVYQLDFGGRVTQESAKNFQIEFRGKQVLQFGRIDGNAYTLDFQYPFSALQAFAVALANITQRLK